MSSITYASDEEFKDVLVDAEVAATTEREQDFVASLQDKFETWGAEMYLSDAQYAWLARIIGDS